MPCPQYDALEACCQARREQGVNSNKLTDNTDDAEEAEDPQEDQTTVKVRICNETIDMFKDVLLFSQGAAVALYNN
jgi:hypothetical protein